MEWPPYPDQECLVIVGNSAMLQYIIAYATQRKMRSSTTSKKKKKQLNQVTKGSPRASAWKLNQFVHRNTSMKVKNLRQLKLTWKQKGLPFKIGVKHDTSKKNWLIQNHLSG